MSVFLFNLEFMAFNLFLALIPVAFGYLMLKAKNVKLKALYGFIWFIFLPNTAYILLDLIHFYDQWPKVNYLFKPILISQYIVFILTGVITFIYAVYFFEKLLSGKKGRKFDIFAILFILNFIIGFGVILGFTQRTNSWYIFSQPVRVLEDTLTLFYFPNLIIGSLAFGILANILYFYFSKPIISIFRGR
ncbi:DUF1361 domain-containing protein [Candidatus Roizmanbacteria bacterium]|nr:DUF1361 domain-containing protein [Candidatus Roizmanbacteria bacterium]